MKISISQSMLAQALGIVSHAVSSRSNLPILENIMITTENDKICLTATNLELGIRYWIPAQIEDPGAITIPAKSFTDLVSELPNDTITLQLNEQTQTLSVRCGQVITDIKGLDAGDFPPIPVYEEERAIPIEIADLKKMISQTAFAASTDESRPVFTGVNLIAGQNEMVMAATDGFRIAIAKITSKEAFENPINALIPARALMELSRITSDSDKETKMVLSPEKSQVIFHLENVELASSLISGSFVDFNSIVPKSFQTTTIVSRTALLKACNQALIIARENKFMARFSISGTGEGMGKIDISAQSDQTGTFENSVDAHVDGNDLQIAFNVRYLKEGLEAIDSENVEVKTNTNVSPGLITPSETDNDYKYVIMPMHV